jgi:hypothetical protein
MGLAGIAATGCSFVIAAGGGSPGVDPRALHLGAARGEIEQVIGAPRSSAIDPDGYHDNTYVFRTSQPPSPERGLTNIALDVITLGLWELVGTPSELILDPGRRERQFTLTFDPDDRLVRIVPPPDDASGAGAATSP